MSIDKLNESVEYIPYTIKVQIPKSKFEELQGFIVSAVYKDKTTNKTYTLPVRSAE